MAPDPPSPTPPPSPEYLPEPLPPRPSLEMQQKRAKELLRSVWAGDSEARARVATLHPHPPAADAMRLADAQLVIARGHGFGTWAELKTKIESLTLPPLRRLVQAVQGGALETARELLEAHPELARHLDEPLGHFGGPLVIAARDNLAMLDLLLAHGADINRRSDWWAGGFGILEEELDPKLLAALLARGAEMTVWAAAHHGDVERLRELLRSDPSLVRAPGGDGKTPLHCAATPEVVDLLVAAGADLEARDVDHESTPLQYLIEKPAVARRLIEHGAAVDIFAAAALGDLDLCERCLEADPGCVSHRLGQPPWTTSGRAGGKIYNWTLGHETTPLGVARKHGHDGVEALLLQRAPRRVRFLDALWRGDGGAVRAELAAAPGLMATLGPEDRKLLAMAAWWYRPAAVALMLELGFDPHVAGAHDSTPLDRAAFHGYADIVALLLGHDSAPPLERRNQFGGTPLSACIHGAVNGWCTGNPQDHARTAELLLAAGAKWEMSWLPTGHDGIDTVLRSAARQG